MNEVELRKHCAEIYLTSDHDEDSFDTRTARREFLGESYSTEELVLSMADAVGAAMLDSGNAVDREVVKRVIKRLFTWYQGEAEAEFAVELLADWRDEDARRAQ